MWRSKNMAWLGTRYSDVEMSYRTSVRRRRSTQTYIPDTYATSSWFRLPPSILSYGSGGNEVRGRERRGWVGLGWIGFVYLGIGRRYS